MGGKGGAGAEGQGGCTKGRVGGMGTCIYVENVMYFSPFCIRDTGKAH